MGKLWKSFTLATAMYSAIPTPRTDWDNDSMAYAFCFFPWVGLVVGGAELVWWKLAGWLETGGLLFAAVAALLPLLGTGGIHLDGFLDVADARSSHQSRARKLEILKDSHVGAFAVIAMGCYLLLYTALWSAVTPHPALILVPVLSRTLSGLAAIHWKNARGSGMLASFSQASALRANRVTLLVWLFAAALALGCLPGWEGIAVLAAALLSVLYYRFMSHREFGGITGDLAGWFVQVMELAALAAVVLVQRLPL